MSEPLIVGFGKGRLPDFPADPDIILDIIPVDFVVMQPWQLPKQRQDGVALRCIMWQPEHRTRSIFGYL